MVADRALRLYRIQQAYFRTHDAWKNADFSPSQKEFLRAFGQWVREIALVVREEEADIALFE